LVETAGSLQITEKIKQEPADEKKTQQTLDKNCVVGGKFEFCDFEYLILILLCI